MRSLGDKRTLQLFKRVYGEFLVVEKHSNRALLRGIGGKRILRGGMGLLTCVDFITFIDTNHLVIQQANLAVIHETPQVKDLYSNSDDNKHIHEPV